MKVIKSSFQVVVGNWYDLAVGRVNNQLSWHAGSCLDLCLHRWPAHAVLGPRTLDIATINRFINETQLERYAICQLMFHSTSLEHARRGIRIVLISRHNVPSVSHVALSRLNPWLMIVNHPILPPFRNSKTFLSIEIFRSLSARRPKECFVKLGEN